MGLIITPVDGLDRDLELEANWLVGKSGPQASRCELFFAKTKITSR